MKAGMDDRNKEWMEKNTRQPDNGRFKSNCINTFNISGLNT